MSSTITTERPKHIMKKSRTKAKRHLAAKRVKMRLQKKTRHTLATRDADTRHRAGHARFVRWLMNKVRKQHDEHAGHDHDGHDHAEEVVAVQVEEVTPSPTM
jgi:hypothetical protein